MKERVLLLVALLAFSSGATEPPVVILDVAGRTCRTISPGTGRGVLLGKVRSRSGQVIDRARVESLSVYVGADGGVRSRDLVDSTTTDETGAFFLGLSGGSLCGVTFSAPGYREQSLVVECSARTCVQIALSVEREDP